MLARTRAPQRRQPTPASTSGPHTKLRPASLLVISALVAGAVVGVTGTTSAKAAVVPDPITHSAADAALSLAPLGSYETGVFDESAAEIVAYHPASERLFVVNAQAAAIDVLDISDPTAPTKLFTITATGVANSVAIRPDGLGVIALESSTKTDPGSLAFFDAAGSGSILGSVPVGAQPDMVTLTADGSRALVANEGEPNDDYSVDPEGSISVVDLPTTVAVPASSAVRTADFSAYEAGGSKTLPAEVRIFGEFPHDTDKRVSRNLEPEYITIDGGTAYAALQEANAVAVIDIASATVTDIWPLGFADQGSAGHGIDPSDRDPQGAPTTRIRTYEGLKGVYMPDGINAYTAGGQTYLVTANEGDAREWGTYVEGERAKNLPLCATSPLQGKTGDGDLGRLNVTTANGYNEADGCYDELYAFGSRSFSIWTTSGEQVFDSGQSFEEITAAAMPDFFNSNHSESNLEGRSDDKGPEPENLSIGEVDGRTYAFIGFERVGGIAVFDITNPKTSIFVTYINNRDFAASGEAGLAAAGDLGPEGVTFISGADSPTGQPLLAVGNEVSGTTTLFQIQTKTTDIQLLGINDFHGRIEANEDPKGLEAGAAVLAGAVTEFRDQNPNTLFVSAGDNIGASTFTSFSQEDNPTIDALVAAGLDVSAVGNHEFDRGFADLRDRVIPRFGDSKFALGANVYDETTGEPVLDEYWLTEIDGVSVGVIGTVTPDTATMVTPTGIGGIEFGDQLEAANRVAGELSDGDAANGEADVIVLLAHDGSATADCATLAVGDSDYANLVRGASGTIDAILSGHTHQEYACSLPVAGWPAGLQRPVVQAGQYGITLDKVTIEVDRATGSVVSMSQGLVPLTNPAGDPLFDADADVQAIVEGAAAAAEVEGAKKVGDISADILRGGTGGSDRGVESTLGNLIADVHLWATSNDDFVGEPAQIAFMNPGGLRADLLYGADGVVTYQEAAEVQPFANTLFTMDLTGAQIKQILEEQWQPAGSSRPKLHLGVSEGFSYTFRADAPRGQHIVSMSFEGEVIAADDVFRVAANSFLAAGGDNFATFAAGTNRQDSGQVDLSATLAFFDTNDVVEPAALGRAVAMSGPGTNPGTNPGVTPGADPAAQQGGSNTTGPGSLATTGVSVGLIAALGILLALAGGMLVRRRRLFSGAADGSTVHG